MRRVQFEIEIILLFSVDGLIIFFLQFGGKFVVYSFILKGLFDGLLYRGVYGFYFVGIFIFLYGVYFMMNDKIKKCLY